MATIHFNSYLVSRFGGLNGPGTLAPSGSTAYVSQLSGGPVGSSTLAIYKGTPGTFPALTDISSRAADLLISFPLPAGAASYVVTSVAGVGFRMLLGVCTTPVAATASGTATWFILRRASGTSLTATAAMIGNVGASGSGADMEIPDVNIINGTSYRSGGIYMTFPYTMTF